MKWNWMAAWTNRKYILTTLTSLFDYKLSQADFDSNVNVEQGKNDYTDGRSSRKTFTD